MGSFCSCFHVQDDDPDDSNHCLCSKCFFKRLKNKHIGMFGRQKNAPNQQLSAGPNSNSGLVFFNHALDATRQGNVDRIGQSESGRVMIINEPETIGEDHVEGDKMMIIEHETDYESEDGCPTCLEEYSEENPKIITKCCHHYHLSCIYEWLERSQHCPVCGKLMEFDEPS